MIKVIVFDFNGVLIADTRAVMATDNHVLKTFGGKPVNFKIYQDTIIIPAVDFYAMHGCDRNELLKNSQKLGEVFHTYYEPRAAKCRSRKGALELLKWLRSKSVASIILSNHTVEGIEFQLKRLKLADYIDQVIANTSLDNSMKQRNKAEKLTQLIKDKNYKKEEILIIGDSPEEIEAGKSLGITTVAITGGYYATRRLKQSHPDYLINNLSELKNIVIGN
jgi:phosphoglycolate phosphatase